MADDLDQSDEAILGDTRHVRVASTQPDPAPQADEDSPAPMALPWLCCLAFLVGIVTGLGAVIFRGLIGFVHNVLFLGQFSFAYDASSFTPAAPWGAFVILVPVVGGLAVTWIVSNFAPEAKGHGVPEVMDAIYYKRGVIRPVVAVVKSLVRTLHWAEDAFDRVPGRYFRHALGMLIVGVTMYLLWRNAGHYYVEGVGYATIQATLYGQLQGGAFLLMLAVFKMLATSISLGSGSSGGVFSPSLFIGATLGASFASLISMVWPGAPVSAPAFAMVGMGAMVGGGTGAAMTAVAMIFEMTRDYDIVLPMIIAVAFSLGVRRMLSRESLYTLKLVRRGHPIPTALHANMFLVQNAAQVMETDVFVLDANTPFRDMLARSEGVPFRHVVVTKEQEIYGVLRINTGLRRAVSQGEADITLGVLAQRNFIVVRENEVAFSVITRLWKQHAVMAVVVGREATHDPTRVLGVIAKEHIADSVASSIRIFPG